MKKGWFELDKYAHGDKTWAIHIYSYEDADESAPDVTLILNSDNESSCGYYVMEFSITLVGRANMFDEAIAMVKKLDELSGNNDSVSLTEHLMVCREFFDCGKQIVTNQNMGECSEDEIKHKQWV